MTTPASALGKAVIYLGKLRPGLLFIGAVFWTLFGGVITLIAMRFFLVDQLHAEATTRRETAAAISARVDTLQTVMALMRERQDSLQKMNDIQRKAICLDHTRTQQQTIGLECPQWLYRGAP